MIWSGLSSDTFGIWLGEDRDQECVAICDRPERVTVHVRAYQEIHRGKERIQVERVPRCEAATRPPTPCGYCGRPHWDWCVTDNIGEPIIMGYQPVPENAAFAEQVHA